MNSPARPRSPLLPLQRGTAATLGVAGLVTLVVMLLGDEPVRALVPLVVAPIVGVPAWLLQRGRWRRQFEGLPVVEGPAAGTARRAFGAGVLAGLAGVAGGAVALVLTSRALGDAPSASLGAGLFLLLALQTALQARDLHLRRWQERRGQVAYSVIGARWFAWTSKQAGSRMVLVRLDSR